MTSNVTRTNNGKLLATVVAIVMIVCAIAAVAVPAEGTEAGQDATSTTLNTALNYGTSIDMNQTVWDGLTTNASIEVTTTTGGPKVVKLLANQTWNLTGDISAANATIDLHGYNLKIAGDHSMSITYAGTNISASLLSSNPQTAANVWIDGSNVSFIGNSAQPGFAVEAMNIKQFYVDGATLTVNKTANANATGTVWHTDADSYNVYDKVTGNNTVLFADASTVTFSNGTTDGSGVQNTAIIATNNSTINASGLGDGSLSIYLSLDDSKVNADILGLYAAEITGTSSVTLETLGLYTGSAASGYPGFDTTNVNLGADSSITATTIINSLTSGISPGSATAIKGQGTVSGTFTNISGTTAYTLDGVTLDGVTAGTGVNITVGEDGVIAGGSVNFTGANVNTTGTIYVASEGSVSGVTDGVYDTSDADEPAQITNFGSLVSAISAGATEVDINSNITVDQDYVIPQDVRVNLSDNVNVAVSNGVNLSGSFTYDETYTTSGSNPTQAVVSVTISIQNQGTGSGVVFTNASGTNGPTIGIVGYDLTAQTRSTLGAEAISSYSTTITDISIDGNASEANININGVEIGTQTLTAPLNLTGDAVIPYGSTLTFAQGGKITVPSEMTLYVYGELKYSGITVNRTQITGEGDVKAIDVSAVQPYCSMDVDGVDDVLINTANDLKNVVPGTTAVFSDSYEESSYLTGNVTLSNVTIYLNGFDLNIGAPLTGNNTTVPSDSRGTLTLDNSTVYRGQDSQYKMSTVNDNTVTTAHNSIVVNAYSAFSIVNSKVFTTVEQANERASITATNPNVTYDNIASEAMVGYGTQLTLTGDLSSSMDVFGTLVIDSTVTVPYGSSLNVYNGATLELNGTLAIQGTANFYLGSTTQIDGTVTVGRTQGGSNINVGNVEDSTRANTADTTFTIGTGGSVTVSGTSSGYAAANMLDVVSGDFVVEGTLTMSGTLSGTVQDKGEITFNGASTDGTIVVFDGVTLTISSVTTTTYTDRLIITDAGVSDDSTDNRANRESSDGNTIVLRNVRNVTVSESVEVFRWTSSNGTNHVDYRSVMTVSGTIPAIDADEGGSVSISGNGIYGDNITGVGERNDQYAYTVIGDLTLGENVDLTIDRTIEVIVSGQLNALADDITIVNNGTLTVEGQIAVMVSGSNAATFTNNNVLNAVTYYITNADGDRTDYYTGLNAAIAAGPDSDNDTVTVYGTVEATETVTIPNGLRVEMQSGSQITVNEDVTLTLADGAKMNGPSATVEVEGTFTAEDYAEDLTVRSVNADVMSTSGASRTWTSLANAIGSGMTEITLNRAIVIDSDLTIPEGVTVTTNIAPVTKTVDGAEYEYSILVDDATLTIEGTLAMNETSEGRIVMTAGAEKDSEIEVDGVFSARLLDDTYELMDNEAGAHFAVVSGAFTTFYVSNVEFAAQTASNNINLDGPIVINGIVSAGDVTFTAVEDGELTINVNQLTSGTSADENMTILSMGTMTLAGNVNFNIGNNTRVSGTVSALCGDGTSSAVIGLDAVEDSLAIRTAVTETADANEYDVYISGSYGGDVTITSGTVTVGTATTAMSLAVTADSTLTVESGAEIIIPDNGSIGSLNATERVPAAVTINGTITIQETDAFTGGSYAVNGTIVVDGINMDVDTGVVLRISGTMDIDEGQYVNINGGRLIVGVEPSVLGQAASGTVNGTVQITSGYILAYTGVDMSGAEIDINAATGESDASTTEYFINGESYATVYASETNNRAGIQIGDINEAEVGGISLNGLFTNAYWFETAEDAEADYIAYSNYSGETYTHSGNLNEDAVGEFGSVYAVFGPAVVSGTISVGQGVTLYIDGIVVTGQAYTFNGYPLDVGTHTVSISANSGYSIEDATITFNGQTVQNGGTITITAEMNTYTLSVSGAAPSDSTVVIDNGSGSDMGLTDYLLIVLVILIVIMAIIVALRLMRS